MKTVTFVTRLATGALVAALAGCTTADPGPRGSRSGAPSSADAVSTTLAPSAAPAESTGRDDQSSAPAAPAFDVRAARQDVRAISSVGPREATSRAYRRASRLVERRLVALGYAVRRQTFRVPAGESWGVAVPAGKTHNLVARLQDHAVDRRGTVVVGAHLDTVPQAPGAEDNASGVAVLLELARLARTGTTRPVTFVVFGAEEPRGPGDDEHHFGSQTYVQRSAQRGEPRTVAMVSLDRVGARGRVPVCTGGLSPSRVRRQLLAAADRLGVPARGCENRTSDHWPFEKAGETVARIGGNPYPAYHSPRDRPGVVSARQLDRVGRVVWEWLSAT